MLRSVATSARSVPVLVTGLILVSMALSGCMQNPASNSARQVPDPLAATTPNGLPPNTAQRIAPDLVRLADIAPGVLQDMRYAGQNNFMDRRIAGYEAPVCWLSRPAAQSLKDIQDWLKPKGLRLKVFDCYRPQTAVDDFVAWGQDQRDQKTKAVFYPRVPKAELFKRGYIAAKSGHSRASTVDLTVQVVDGKRANGMVRGPLADGQELDMGTPFDLFDPQSHTENTEQPPDVQFNRRWLRSLMQRHGWRNIPEEWWHFTLVNEPYPESYFSQPVSK